MNWIGVITGDIINSTEILNAGQRDKLLEVMHRTVEEMNATARLGKISIDIYRGDSFQLLIDQYYSAAFLGFVFRSNLIANSSTSLRWDTRIGIGIGKGEFIVDKVAQSDGEAFHLSGKAFDSLDKNNRMSVLSPDQDFNEELKVSTAFADNVISDWTPSQANIAYILAQDPSLTQKEVAQKNGISQQAVSKAVANSKVVLVANYLIRISEKAQSLLSSQKS